MERTIYERADGGSTARLSAPAASQGQLQLSFSEGWLPPRGRKGRAAACALGTGDPLHECGLWWTR